MTGAIGMAAWHQRTSTFTLHALFNSGAIGQLSDGELLERSAGGRLEARELAFAALVERHGPMVLRVCRRALACPHDADDAFQATFHVLARRAGSLRVEGPLGPWLFRVACRAAARIRRDANRRSRRERHAAGLMPTAALEDQGPDEVVAAVHEELGRLPARYRVALVLCYLEGMTAEQAARELGWPAGTVRSRLARGRDRLRVRLTARGLTLSVSALVAALTPRTGWSAVPANLASATARSAAACATGQLAAGAVPAAVASLAESLLTETMMMKLKAAGLALLAGCLLIGGALCAGQGQSAGNPRSSPEERLRTVEEKLDRLILSIAGSAQTGRQPATRAGNGIVGAQDAAASRPPGLAPPSAPGSILMSVEGGKIVTPPAVFPSVAPGDVLQRVEGLEIVVEKVPEASFPPTPLGPGLGGPADESGSAKPGLAPPQPGALPPGHTATFTGAESRGTLSSAPSRVQEGRGSVRGTNGQDREASALAEMDRRLGEMERKLDALLKLLVESGLRTGDSRGDGRK